MNNTQLVDNLSKSFSKEDLINFLRNKDAGFKPRKKDLQGYDDDRFTNFEKIGEIHFSDVDRVAVVTVDMQEEMTERTSKKKQYDKAKKILKDLGKYEAGLFAFVGENGAFRLSLVYEIQMGSKRKFSNFRRYTFYVNSDLPNKTFRSQMREGSFDSLDSLKEVFSITAVTDEFYKRFKPKFDKIAENVRKQIDEEEENKQELAEDFTLLFVIRAIFIGFVQKREWIGDDEKFLETFWNKYKKQNEKHNHRADSEEDKIQDNFYSKWLQPLFFQALSKPPGAKVEYGENNYPSDIEKSLQMAPHLNGGLFREKDIDKKRFYIPDEQIEEFFNFIFSYNFTIEENTLYDEDLELNPEFLGIIFERLVNKEDGAIYTPRTEVDFMCRLSLVKWLEKNTEDNIETDDLYELMFPERGTDNDQKYGSFSINEMETILEKLENVTICDPAVGSGAFPVGMIQVLEEVEQNLEKAIKLQKREPVKDQDEEERRKESFQRRKRIIQKSLYGVEVKEWAVWICQLRLWIKLFVDAPEEMEHQQEAILPSLDFKIRQGDSLVQRIGDKMFSVQKNATGFSKSTKRKIITLKKKKAEFFNNENVKKEDIQNKEENIFREILDQEINETENQLNKFRKNRMHF